MTPEMAFECLLISHDQAVFCTVERVLAGSADNNQALAGVKCGIHVQARLLWTREYGLAGCQFVRIPPGDLQVLYAWLESRYRFKKPLVEM